MATAKFEIYSDPDEAGKFRWKLLSSNGQETALSPHHFVSHADAKRSAEHVKEHAATAEILDA
jgi:uncharacterized protein YegP (UPF0339 family)